MSIRLDTTGWRTVIHWELCKKLKFDHMNKSCMHNPEPVLENEMHKILGDLKMQTDHLISARRPDLVIVKEKNSGPCPPARPQSKIKRKPKEL